MVQWLRLVLPMPVGLGSIPSQVSRSHLPQLRVHIGTYLGYTVAFYSLFYDINHLIILGRVTSGKGGDILMARAQMILDEEFPELGVKISMPNEKMRRVGQSIAAASLPSLA